MKKAIIGLAVGLLAMAMVGVVSADHYDYGDHASVNIPT